MVLNRLYELVALCLDRFPESYPRPRIILHESSEALVAYRGDTRHSYLLNNGYPASLVAGMAEVEKNAIHLSYDYIATATEDEVLDLILHENGHIFSGCRYGPDSPEYLDENRANAFARRWFKKIKAFQKEQEK